MARMGVFSRNDDTPEAIPRSLQILSHSNSFDAKYMEIYPTFCQVLQPNETIRLRSTMFVRTIPMNTPMMSRVKLVTRYYAVPFRIMWQPWENWIKGEDDTQFQYELPYLVNSSSRGVNFAQYPGQNSGIGIWSATPSQNLSPTNSWNRVVRVGGDSLSGYVQDNNPSVSAQNNDILNCGVHELGDYLGYPLFTLMGKNSDGKYLAPHAFKACAYQLCYSYGYRSPNVQTRIDDYREMLVNQYMLATPVQNKMVNGGSLTAFELSYDPNPQSDEFPPTYVLAQYNSANDSVTIHQNNARTTSILGTQPNLATSSDRKAIIATSWDKVEHFPLKAGANLSMLAQDVDSVTGLPKYVPSNISLYRMRFANWQTDYFTSANPWQQRGEEALIPVQGSVTVTLPAVDTVFGYLDNTNFGGIVTDGGFLKNGSTADWLQVKIGVNNGANPPNAGTVTTKDLSLSVSPSAFRFAMALQHIKEMQAQTDNRYKSYMRKIFGSYIQDNRIDRPEFIGGSVQMLNVSDVVQSSASADDSSPLGSLAGRGISSKTSNTIHFHATEHTVIIGLTHIVPDTAYLQGLEKEDNVHDRFDFPMPQFGHLSEQPVYNYELSATHFWNGSDLYPTGDNYSVFGYEPIYNDYRWKRNRVCGAFRDVINQTGNKEWYKPWLVTRDFGYQVFYGATQFWFGSVQPTLSDKFLSGRFGVDYSNFVVTDPKLMYPFIVDCYFEQRMTRIIPNRGLPSKY